MMWCDTCERSVHAPMGFCSNCGTDMLGFGTPAVLEDSDRFAACVVCRTAEAEQGFDLCDSCYCLVQEADPDDYPEICPGCCSMLLSAGQTVCPDCTGLLEPARPKASGYSWWGDDDWDEPALPVPPASEELETIPAIRKV